jgi:hypothetical protein
LLGLIGTKLRVVCGAKSGIEGRRIRARVVHCGLAQGGCADLIGHLPRRDQVAAPDLYGVQVEGAGEEVHRPFAHERALVASRRSIGAGWGLVCEDAGDVTPVVRNPVGSRQQGCRQFGNGDAVGAKVGPHVHRDAVDQGDEAPIPCRADLELVGLLS